jgi:hypothetical protein
MSSQRIPQNPHAVLARGDDPPGPPRGLARGTTAIAMPQRTRPVSRAISAAPRRLAASLAAAGG